MSLSDDLKKFSKDLKEWSKEIKELRKKIKKTSGKERKKVRTEIQVLLDKTGDTRKKITATLKGIFGDF